MVRDCGHRCFGAGCWEPWSDGASKMPHALFMAYFFIGWEEVFPLTAMKALLMDELKFSLATFTTYIAIKFMPWMWKPVYGYISDNFPIAGYHRGPYMLICAVLNAILFLLFAVFANSVATVFILGTTHSVSTAFVQLMVDARLNDIAKSGNKVSATLQSLANTAKSAGTFTAQLAALLVYAHTGGEWLLSARQAIALTAVAPTALAIAVPLMREAPANSESVDVAALASAFAIDTSQGASAPPLINAQQQTGHESHMQPNVYEQALVGTRGHARSRCCSSRREGRTKLSPTSKRVAVVVLVTQVNLVVIGCQSLMKLSIWLHVLIASAVASCLLGVLLLAAIRHCERKEVVAEPGFSNQPVSVGTSDFGWCWARIALFCFLANLIPTSGLAVDMLQLWALTLDSYQSLSIISSFTGICAALAFGGGFHAWSVRKTIVGSVFVSMVAALAPLPFVMFTTDVRKNSISLQSPLGMLSISASVVGSIATMFSVLPIDTLILSTSSLEGRKSSTALAIFLACYSFGATVQGLVSAPLITALGLDRGSWHALPAWIIATACAKLLILLMLPLLPTELCLTQRHGAQQAPNQLGDGSPQQQHTTLSMESY